jgi:predicted ATP-grasp superfamily ATP-dependent carboligase
MCGYVGVDLIFPDATPHQPVVVEINPRLTTSYLGYRALAENNLAEWMLIPRRFERPIQWRQGVVEFDAAGKIEE